VRSTIRFTYVIVTDDNSSQVLESELLPDVGEILFHTDMESGCSSMTWKYREQRVIDRLSVMPVPFSISAEYDIIDHNFQVLHLLDMLLYQQTSVNVRVDKNPCAYISLLFVLVILNLVTS